MEDLLRNAESQVRLVGETMLPYRAYLLSSAGLIGFLLLRLRYPHKVKFLPTANSIPDVVFSSTAHNFQGTIVGISTQNGLQLQLVHKPNWIPFSFRKFKAISVHVAGIARVGVTAETVLREKLVGKMASIALTGRNKEENAVEAWVYIRRNLRKHSLSHLLISLDMASTRPLPSPGFTLTSETSHFWEMTLQQQPQPQWYTRLYRRFYPLKF